MSEPNIHEAVRLLGAYSAGRFEIWALAGPAKASCRAHVMSELAGHRVPQKNAGVSALEKAFYEIAEIEERGYAGEDALKAWCEQVLAAEEEFKWASIEYQGPG